MDIAEQVLDECRRKRSIAAKDEEDLSDEAVSKLAQFTDRFSLACYAWCLHYVPRLVNIVTVWPPCILRCAHTQRCWSAHSLLRRYQYPGAERRFLSTCN